MVSKKQGRNGFTLIELMVVLAVAAIIAAISAPSFADMIRNHRLTTQANLILSELYYARSEAIRRGLQISIRRNSANNNDWTEGWQVFTDVNGNGSLDAGTDVLLKVREPLTGNFTLTSAGNYTTWLAYLPSGYPSSADAFSLCADNNINQARTISVSNTGRPSVTSGAAAC
jgi:type IV fimbrial biogenesis protein FimT